MPGTHVFVSTRGTTFPSVTFPLEAGGGRKSPISAAKVAILSGLDSPSSGDIRAAHQVEEDRKEESFISPHGWWPEVAYSGVGGFVTVDR